ncbi:MAG: choline dehydrogenase-like flavoprotein, partial [Thalassolituus oleivorans]
MKRFQTRDEVDFVIVGSGAAGGIMARELSVAGFDVVVLEQGKYRKREDFNHDEWTHFVQGAWTNDPDGGQRQTFRSSLDEEAAPLPVAPAYYARTVGGSSVHFTANFWRFHPIDFNEASVLGSIPGTNLADWPIDYDELEPYYTRVDYEIGVSGEQGPFDPSRSRPWAMPPLPPKASGVLFDKGASALGLHSQPAPMAINSELFKGAPPCMNCGFCLGYGCEVGAKSSTLERMIPEAEATGRCEIRSECTVFNVATGPDGRVTEVRYFDPDGVEQAQRARAVVLCANGAETSKLLLMSENSQQP